MNSKFKHILIKNNSNNIVHIFKNCRIKQLTKLNFFNVFQINFDEIDEITNFVFRKFFKKHKTN